LPRPPEERVVLGAAIDKIVPSAAVDDVVASAAEHNRPALILSVSPMFVFGPLR
jgi:hypothetical protein